MSQESQILNHLKDGYPITAMGAYNLCGCMRLASRTYDLRRDGHDIAVMREKNRRNDGYHAKYFLTGKKK